MLEASLYQPWNMRAGCPTYQASPLICFPRHCRALTLKVECRAAFAEWEIAVWCGERGALKETAPPIELGDA